MVSPCVCANTTWQEWWTQSKKLNKVNVYKYSDELGTKYLIHEVTDARGYIIHRDFDAVRISSGQLINKGH